jgi:tetratricopeptide (TPR) repeat protein
MRCLYTRPMAAAAAPDNTADAALDRALDHMAGGDPVAAIPCLRQALALEPGHTAATHALMRALQEAGGLEEAVALAHTRIAADPDDALAYTRLSVLHQAMGKIPEAEAAAARAKILGWKQQLRNPEAESL